MKVLIISCADSGAGAGIAAKRLCDDLIKNGIDVDMYVQNKNSSASYISTIPQKKFGLIYKVVIKAIDIFLPFIFKTTNGIYHSLSILSKNDFSWVNDSDYDIVHLHWVNDVISIREVSTIKKPIVWTMHDSWVCCGAEHHPNVLESDKRWTEGYYRYNKPATTSRLDVCRYVWQIKAHYWKKSKIWFIAPSNWEKSILKQSKLFSQSNCTAIPNILPYDVFYERNRMLQRQKMNIPTNKKILGFGAASWLDNPKSMKGTKYLIEAINEIPNPQDYYLIIFGPAKSEFTDLISIPFYSAGYVDNPNMLAELYSCCDCFVNSSLIENFGYTVFESLACGTPVVAFAVGGTKDLIIHMENGYLANPYQSEDLVRGIEYCINKEDIREECKKIKERFSAERIIKEHMEVYKKAIEDFNLSNGD